MARLLIQFRSAELDDFRWANIDTEEPTADIAWQEADEEELPVIAGQYPHPVVLIIPQQCVYLTQVELPERAGRQLLSAIEYQIEDQLARDIESQHFALGDTGANPISIAVVERDIMARCMALAQGHGLRLLQVLPELFLSPWPGSGVVITPGYEGYLVRYGDYRGLKCAQAALPAMLDLVRKEIEFDSVTCFDTDDGAPPAVGSYALEQRSLSEVRSGFVNAPVIDLQQRDFKLSSVWQSLGKAWKWIGIMLAVLLAVGAYNKAVALHDLEQELAAVKKQQFKLLKPHLPGKIGPDDNLKKALIARLKELQANQVDQGFLQLMLDFARAREKFPEVRITRISYQGQQLSFDISSAELTKIETLLEAVKKQGVDATLVSLNVKPDQSSGRLVMRGGNDV